MRMTEIIEKKKYSKALNRDEIAYFVKGFTNGDIPDYQAAALTMAIWFSGMTKAETAALTAEMAASGDCLDLSVFGGNTADKHSSGGVGDKTTLIAAPIAAAAGVTVAKMSGRGLGFTGGTIDKLESIPGLSTTLTPKAFFAQAAKTGIVVAGQTGNMAPCDKKLYALRDVTGTVDSIALIASSIMSKKLAAGAKNIVLDVKCGAGAFMQTPQRATELAQEMVDIGTACGRTVSACITEMSAPLGYCIGNTLEIQEAAEILNGKPVEDLRELSVALAGEMIAAAKKISRQQAVQLAQTMLDSRKALYKLCEMVDAQGGDATYIIEPKRFKNAAHYTEICAQTDGYITEANARLLGEASVLLGAGRAVKTDDIDFAAGIVLHKKPGDAVCRGEVLITLFSNDEKKLPPARLRAKDSIKISSAPVPAAPLIHKIIRAENAVPPFDETASGTSA